MSKTASWVLVFAVGGCDTFSRDGEYWRITGFGGKSWVPLGLPRVLRLEERERVAFGLRWDISALLCVWPLGWGGGHGARSRAPVLSPEGVLGLNLGPQGQPGSDQQTWEGHSHWLQGL